jgi:dihydrofolate reductase
VGVAESMQEVPATVHAHTQRTPTQAPHCRAKLGAALSLPTRGMEVYEALMLRFRIFIAQSLDGYIARPDGAIDWLRPFDSVDYGYEAFLAEIGTVVMGRKSYELARSFGEWPYPNARCLVITSQALDDMPPNVTRVGADVSRLVTALRASGGKDVWVMGGAMTIGAFLEAQAIDRIDLFTIPILLGYGVPLFSGGRPETQLKFAGTQTYDKGLVRLSYLRA